MLYAGFRRYGRVKTLIFFAGSILWTAPIENIGVVTGSYTYYGFAGLFLTEYPGYLFWVGLVPLWIELGWFVVALSSFIVVHEVILPKRRAVVQAVASGLLAVNMDAVIDPVASSNELWVWLAPSIYVLGVPAYNWVGWFLLVFFYDIAFEHTVLDYRPLKGLNAIEKLLFKGNVVSSESKIIRFAFRLVVLSIVVTLLLILVQAAMMPFSYIKVG